MTGPEHFREAERILNEAQGLDSGNVDLAPMLAEAQVHATLALAAATAASQANAWDGDESHTRSAGWAGVA